MGQQPLTAQLWESAETTYAAILDHPAIHKLTDGSLPLEIFRHFVVQGSHFRRDYARALALCAAKAPTDYEIRAFADDAAGAIVAEQDVQEQFIDALGGRRPRDNEVLPTTLAYTSYLLATVYSSSFAEGLAAVLPCYYFYARIGVELHAKSSPEPLYARWISVYSDQTFQTVVRRVLALTDRIGQELSEAERRRAVWRFSTTARYEWMFWDAAWRGETWPV